MLNMFFGIFGDQIKSNIFRNGTGLSEVLGRFEQK
jgi:hypothetical protein